jgi:hypothetical protein
VAAAGTVSLQAGLSPGFTQTYLCVGNLCWQWCFGYRARYIYPCLATAGKGAAALTEQVPDLSRKSKCTCGLGGTEEDVNGGAAVTTFVRVSLKQALLNSHGVPPLCRFEVAGALDVCVHHQAVVRGRDTCASAVVAITHQAMPVDARHARCTDQHGSHADIRWQGTSEPSQGSSPATTSAVSWQVLLRVVFKACKAS